MIRVCVVDKRKVYHDIISIEILEQVESNGGRWTSANHWIEAVTHDRKKWLYVYDQKDHAWEDFARWRDEEPLPRSISLWIDGRNVDATRKRPIKKGGTQ